MTVSTARAALTAVFLLGAASVAMAADKPAAAPKLTPAVQKHLIAAQAANNKQDFPTALTELDAASQISGLTPADTVMINRFKMSVHIGMKNFDAADIDAEAAADSDPSGIADADKPGLYKAALQLALNAKHYDKAAKYGKLLVALPEPQDGPTQGFVAQALYLGGDYAGAMALAQKNIDAANAAHQVPNRMFYDTLMSSQVKMKDEPGAERTLETLVSAYNAPEDWAQLLPVTLTTKGMRDIDYVYVGRLWLATGAKVGPQDASLFGSTASKLAFYGDAVAAEKVGGKDFPVPDAKADADKKTMPAQIAAGAKQGGEYNVKTAEALVGYGMYPEAEKMARDAKTKGGAKDASEPDMVIGMSQVGQGKYADAATTFGGIQQANPASARVVRLWTLYAKSKANPPAPAPAAAAAQ
jgi:tetratricopeptide (TPR) repeat protein